MAKVLLHINQTVKGDQISGVLRRRFLRLTDYSWSSAYDFEAICQTPRAPATILESYFRLFVDENF